MIALGIGGVITKTGSLIERPACEAGLAFHDGAITANRSFETFAGHTKAVVLPGRGSGKTRASALITTLATSLWVGHGRAGDEFPTFVPVRVLGRCA